MIEEKTLPAFPERHSDYGSGCGYVDIDFPDAGAGVFAAGEKALTGVWVRAGKDHISLLALK